MKWLWLLSLLCLACHRPVKVEVQRVEIPIAVPCPKPARPQRPALPISKLPANAGTDEVLKALVAGQALLQGYAKQLEVLIWGE